MGGLFLKMSLLCPSLRTQHFVVRMRVKWLSSTVLLSQQTLSSILPLQHDFMTGSYWGTEAGDPEAAAVWYCMCPWCQHSTSGSENCSELQPSLHLIEVTLARSVSLMWPRITFKCSLQLSSVAYDWTFSHVSKQFGTTLASKIFFSLIWPFLTFPREWCLATCAHCSVRPKGRHSTGQRGWYWMRIPTCS